MQRLLQSHLRQTFDGLDAIPAPAVVTEPPIKREDSENEAAFDFRLFLRPSQAQIQTNGLDLSGRSQKVVIRSPTPDVREPGFLVPHKAETAYLTKDRTARQAEQFRRAAVTGEDIITRANQHCVSWAKIWHWISYANTPQPGCELPWRVTTIKSSGRQNFAHESAPSEVQATRRKRAGKKRRIAIRKKDALKKKQRETEARLRAEKEAAEKEKRTRRNREKKVKRKAKEKSKKTGDVELDTSRQSDKT